MGQSSCNQIDKVRLCETTTVVDQCSKNPDCETNKKFNSRYFYNSAVRPTTVDLLLAKKCGLKNVKKQDKKSVVNTRVICRAPSNGSYSGRCESGQMVNTKNQVKGVKVLNNSVNMCRSNETSDNTPGLDVDLTENNSNLSHVTSEEVKSSDIGIELNVSDSSGKANVKTKGGMSDSFIPLYDVNFVGIEDKFASSIMFSPKCHAEYVNQPIYQKWLTQSDFKFGYVPLQAQMMPMGSNQGP